MNSWLRDTAAAWLRTLTVAGDRSRTLEQQGRLLEEVNGPARLRVKLRRFRWPWQRAVADETLQAAGAAAGDLLNRHLITAMLTTEHLIARLRQATGQSREQILQDIAISIEQQITAAEDAGVGDPGDGDDVGSDPESS